MHEKNSSNFYGRHIDQMFVLCYTSTELQGHESNGVIVTQGRCPQHTLFWRCLSKAANWVYAVGILYFRPPQLRDQRWI